jgi:N-hydroxyarylamine O-acetyltransferase
MQYLADVGFGAFSAEPLQFVAEVEQNDPAGTFVIRRHDLDYYQVAKQVDFGWKSEYIFKPLGHDLSEFADRCEWQQTSPDSHFTNGRLCSLMTVNGRKTLTDDKFILTEGSRKSEIPIVSEDEFETVLFTQFGVTKAGISQSHSLADQYIN